MLPESRLVFSGEYSSLFIEESEELKNTLYEIILEDFVKKGEIHLKYGFVIDEKKMIEYFKKEFHHTGEYTKLRETVEQGVKELHEYRESKKV